jgi:hypothetical protein
LDCSKIVLSTGFRLLQNCTTLAEAERESCQAFQGRFERDPDLLPNIIKDDEMRLEFTDAIQKLSNSCLSGTAHHSTPKKMARKVCTNVKYWHVFNIY